MMRILCAIRGHDWKVTPTTRPDTLRYECTACHTVVLIGSEE